MIDRRRLLPLAVAPLFAPGSALALGTPTGEVVLSLSGKLRSTNRREQAVYDMPMLERLPQTSYSTHTPWFVNSRKFTGPLLRDVLQSAGAHGRQLRLGAINDYRVDVPVDDALRWEVIIARLLDDRPMAVRDKGPLFIMYPFDSRAELRSPLYFSRCAWQLKTIEVL